MARYRALRKTIVEDAFPNQNLWPLDFKFLENSRNTSEHRVVATGNSHRHALQDIRKAVLANQTSSVVQDCIEDILQRDIKAIIAVGDAFKKVLARAAAPPVDSSRRVLDFGQLAVYLTHSEVISARELAAEEKYRR